MVGIYMAFNRAYTIDIVHKSLHYNGIMNAVHYAYCNI